MSMFALSLQILFRMDEIFLISVRLQNSPRRLPSTECVNLKCRQLQYGNFLLRKLGITTDTPSPEASMRLQRKFSIEAELCKQEELNQQLEVPSNILITFYEFMKLNFALRANSFSVKTSTN